MSGSGAAERLVLVLEVDARGHGVGELDGRRVRLPEGLPGDLWRVAVGRGRRDRVHPVELLRPGPERRIPPCPHAGTCGGCPKQAWDPGARGRWIASRVVLQLQPFAERGVLPLAPLRAAVPLYGFRNRMEFSFGTRRWVLPDEPEGADRGFALGLHVPGRYDRVLDIETCLIVFPEAPAILGSARSHARALGLPAYDVRSHEGLLRHLVVRKGFATGEILVALVTGAEDAARVQPYLAALAREHPGVTTWVWTVQESPGDTARGGRETVVAGPGIIEEVVAGLRFRISAQSFFQTSTCGAEALVAVVRELAHLHPDATVLDVCCGTGLFGLALAGMARRVVGFELAGSGCEDARRSAARNGIRNFEVVEGDVRATLPHFSGAADLVVLDPPRGGLHPSVDRAVLALRPRRILLVACNLPSQAGFLAAAREAGYRLGCAVPLDLFPHTDHAEVVLALEAPA